MSPILTSILLGLTAAAANVFGGAIIVQKNWERSYLRYFVAPWRETHASHCAEAEVVDRYEFRIHTDKV